MTLQAGFVELSYAQISTWYHSLSDSRVTYLFTHQAQRVLDVRGVYWEKLKSHIR